MGRLWLSALLLQGCFYITPDEYQARWDLDGDGVERPQDCDDADPGVQVRVWYLDEDGDGFGGDETVEACEPVDGAVEVPGDCDDSDRERHPDAPEVCNGVDDDCDDEVDEDTTVVTWYADADGDTYGDPAASTAACVPPADHVQNGDDCDDGDAQVNPGAAEVCNEIDDDCDELVDFDDPDMDAEAYTWTEDADGDGWGDEAGMAVLACEPATGYGPPGDCLDDPADPDAPYVNPDADEVCDGVDNDCNGATDGSDAVDAPTWLEDCDGDGFGNPSSPVVQCTDQPIGGGCALVPPDQIDCDDTSDSVHFGAPELCDNGIDDDCDTEIDDLDGDGCITDTADTGA